MGYNRVLNDHTLGLSVCVCVAENEEKNKKSLESATQAHLFFY